MAGPLQKQLNCLETRYNLTATCLTIVGLYVWKPFTILVILVLYIELQQLYHLNRRKDAGEIWGCRHMVEARHGRMEFFFMLLMLY